MIKLNTINTKKVMEKEGLNQATFAKVLGLSRACVNRHLTGSRRHPSAKFIGAVKEAFPEYSFDYFFTVNVTKKGQKETEGRDYIDYCRVDFYGRTYGQQGC